MNKEKIISALACDLKKKYLGEATGHDWWHIRRVWQLAKLIAKKEGADLFVVQLGVLLHDITDQKFYDLSEEEASVVIRTILRKFSLSFEVIKQVLDIVSTISFRDNVSQNITKTLEAKVVQDADRLDALGAIGIARAFAYGGSKGRPIYDPEIKIQKIKTEKDYKKSGRTTVNHFYEKLFKLRERMNTGTARVIAKEREEIMLKYLQYFFDEWDMEDAIYIAHKKDSE